MPQKTPKVWIDLDNSPHVPFFAPIIRELNDRGYSVFVTARDCFQVCELAELFGIPYRLIGRHYGKHKLLKAAGTCIRALQLASTAFRERPSLALSHGSRSQLLAAWLRRIRSIVIVDYEFAKGLRTLRPEWVIFPEVVAANAARNDSQVLTYPGIKEDVYVPEFRPDASIMGELGLREEDLIVVLRPPANEAHYHNPESEKLLDAVLKLLRDRADARVVLLPRNKAQEAAIRKDWPDLFATKKMFVPDHAVDGLNLIWHSDLVISGGGTMNREAAALGVPVYSIFRGTIGAVDRYLAASNRLVLLESVRDVQMKIALERRVRPSKMDQSNSRALSTIVAHVSGILERIHATAPATDAGAAVPAEASRKQ